MLMPPAPAHAFNAAEDVLRFYLSHSPPDHALWKTIEWRLFRSLEYPGPVLDLGCGDGVFAKLVFDQPLTAGIDILRGRVHKAGRVGAHELPVTGDATAMPFADGSFRTVFSGCAMEHVPPLPQMLNEIARVLQPGGRLITTVPSGYFGDYLLIPTLLRRWGFGWLGERYSKLIVRLLTIAHMYHPARWQEHLATAGLDLISAQHFLPRVTTGLFDKLLIMGNLLQPIMFLLRGTPVHRRYVAWLYDTLLPHITAEEPTGGALLLVARKPEA